ncbi:MAG: hypothetical protein ACRD3M_06020 [Thermoanaerobaculia bacterium]
MPAAEGGPVAIVTALEEEFDAITGHARDVRFGRDLVADASIGRTEVVIARTGDGAQRAARGAAALCDARRPSALIGAGVAGALSRDLAIGEILVSRRIRDARGEAPASDARLLARAVASGATEATLVTADRPVTSASGRAELLRSLGQPTPSAVDMESAGWARAAAARGIPYIVVRAVSDGAEEELPEYLARCVGEDGSVRRAAALLHALARPATIMTLLRMRSRVVDGTGRVSVFLEKLLDAGA